MKALYYEDLQKDIFVMAVEISKNRTILEQRKWYKNNYEYTPEDHFLSWRKENNPTQEECYKWIVNRSELIARSPVTQRRSDRVWVTPKPVLPLSYQLPF